MVAPVSSPPRSNQPTETARLTPTSAPPVLNISRRFTSRIAPPASTTSISSSPGSTGPVILARAANAAIGSRPANAPRSNARSGLAQQPAEIDPERPRDVDEVIETVRCPLADLGHLQPALGAAEQPGE